LRRWLEILRVSKSSTQLLGGEDEEQEASSVTIAERTGEHGTDGTIFGENAGSGACSLLASSRLAFSQLYSTEA